jgi:predicted dehydrogenase
MSESKRTIKVAVIAGGNRSRAVVKNLLDDSNGNVEVVSLFEPDPKVVELVYKDWGTTAFKVCDSYQAAVDTAGVDWVMVFSPNVYHKDHIIYAFEQGKHVFTEKPLATTVEDCQAVFDAHQQSNRLFATGFVLRYAPIYRKAKEILDSGKLGKILSIDANENIRPGHGGYIMRNWRRLTKYSGPHILEKCCHDLDLINWFCESIPSKVASFGGLDFFIPENDDLVEKYGDKTFMAWEDPHAEKSAFTSDKDMKDNQVGIMEYRNNIRVMFQATMSNAIPERRMYFSCTEGTMIVELYSGTLKYSCIGDEGITLVNITGDGHGGGDSFIMKELYDTMSNGTLPKCSGNEGLESAVVAIMLDEAANSGMTIDLEPIWKNLQR